ncbi:tryptophan--tRNA ligase [Patescibacteria group bacterium]
MTNKPIAFSGIQPSGALHLGNYVGAIQQWIEMQKTHDLFISIVDYHAMTVPYEASEMPERVRNLALDLLALGIDPEKCTFFVQSYIPEHTELAWIFNTLTPLGELERMTQFKEKSEQHKQRASVGLMTYPLLQAADILMYDAEIVPVGEDQVQHIELARDTARKFNNAYGETFVETKAAINKSSRLLGLDGKGKMSKSNGEKTTLMISDDTDTVLKKIRKAVVKPADMPANAQTIFDWHDTTFDTPETKEHSDLCRNQDSNCKEYKELVAKNISEWLAPIQECRAAMEKAGKLDEILKAGAEKAQSIAKAKMEEVRKIIGIR